VLRLVQEWVLALALLLRYSVIILNAAGSFVM
jgi:hypothetical protein